MTQAAQTMNGSAGGEKYAPRHDYPRPAAVDLPAVLRDVSVSGAQLLAEGEAKTEFVIDGLVEAGDVVLLAGREKDALKTWLCLDLVVARIVGGLWLGRTVTSAGGTSRVLLVSCETSARNIARRLKALCKGRGASVERVAERLVVIDEPVTMIPRDARDRAATKAELAAKVAGLKSVDAERGKRLKEAAKTIAGHEAAALGSNLDVLAAIEDLPVGTWSLVVIDTLRQCLAGDENSSDDARQFMRAARDLARAADCPIVCVHHSNKSGDGSDARSARGSVEITAAPDVILSIDTSGDHPTMHHRLRNHEAPPPCGYTLVRGEDGVRIEVRDASAGGAKAGVTSDDVLAVFRSRPTESFSMTTLRSEVSRARGGAQGAKATATTVQRHLDALVAAGAVAMCSIVSRDGRTFPGWKLGQAGGVADAMSPGAAGGGFIYPARRRR